MAERGPSKSDVPAKVWRAIPIDPELSKPGEEVRVLPDGRVLSKPTSVRGVREYPSREAFVQWWKEANEEAARGPVDFLPPSDDFLRDVETHAKALGPRLNIPDATLDGTVASLKAVDKALKRIPRADRPVADLVTPLVAYVGEVVRRGSEGRWAKREEKPPSILAGNAQRSFDPYVDVVMPMFEPSKRPLSLHATVHARLVGAGYPGALNHRAHRARSSVTGLNRSSPSRPPPMSHEPEPEPEPEPVPVPVPLLDHAHFSSLTEASGLGDGNGHGLGLGLGD